MKTIVFAYHSIGCEGINALINNGYKIEAIFTHQDDPDENIWFDSVADLASDKGIPVYAPESVNHQIWIEKIKEIKPDYIFSFYYRNMIAPEIIKIPQLGAFNLHGSLLPAYRGKCPVNWAIINGESETGVTLHYMTEKPDYGDIAGQKAVQISDDDTAFTLHKKLASASKILLDEILPAISSGTVKAVPQDNSKASYFGGRKPEDGQIDWNMNADSIKNLVQAVTKPYPGAFSYAGTRKLFIWKVKTSQSSYKDKKPGTIISTSPLEIACGENSIIIESGQLESGITMTGDQLASEMRLVTGYILGSDNSVITEEARKKHVLILGVNGFIGNALTERLLKSGRYIVHGMDIHSNGIERLLGEKDFFFHEGDISIHREWIEYHVKKCDIILPLVAIATPVEYTRNPLRVFELDFEENLRIVRYCAKYKKRILFPSTSEVYGMCQDENFDEDNSNLILGPINKQRWIYSCSKQLLDRVIYAYGKTSGLEFTLFRPFNWMGPRLDSLSSARIGSSRAITQLILNLVEGTPIQLVDGGEQKRCFTDIKDGVECLFRIIENKNNVCAGRIINIGSPANEASIKQLAEILVEKFNKHPLASKFPSFAGIKTVESKSFYGEGYQDVQHRKPSIENAKKLLNWTPVISIEQSVEETLNYFLEDTVAKMENN